MPSFAQLVNNEYFEWRKNRCAVKDRYTTGQSCRRDGRMRAVQDRRHSAAPSHSSFERRRAAREGSPSIVEPWSG
jgi:hypothetical protein